MFLFCKRRLEVIVKKLFSARADCVSDSNVPSIFVFNFYENKGRDRLAKMDYQQGFSKTGHLEPIQELF